MSVSWKIAFDVVGISVLLASATSASETAEAVFGQSLLSEAPRPVGQDVRDEGLVETDSPIDAFLDPSLELVVSSDSVWLAFRSPFARGSGHWAIGGLANDDDDYLLNLRLLRYGAPLRKVPIALGAGLGGYFVSLDEPDADAYALALTGSATYSLPLEYPLNVAAEVSYAPDVTTFDDGEEFLDFRIDIELVLSPFITVLAGYRLIEVELDDGPVEEVDDRVHVGVRLSL